MQYRVDPRSGNKISALGLGCMRFPGYAVGHPDPVAAEAVISRAVERGSNYLDTAYLYPGNEELVGATLERLGLGERVLVATKLPHASCVGEGDFDRFFDEELRRLRRDHVDYYLMHNVTSPAQWERLRSIGIEGWLDRQRSNGRIREVGFSFHGSEGDFPVLLDAYDWDFCQIQYNYVGERYQAGTAGLMAAHERGMAVFVMEPLLGGRLADKMPDRARRILDAAGSPLPGLAAADGDGATSPAANAAPGGCPGFGTTPRSRCFSRAWRRPRRWMRTATWRSSRFPGRSGGRALTSSRAWLPSSSDATGCPARVATIACLARGASTSPGASRHITPRTRTAGLRASSSTLRRAAFGPRTRAWSATVSLAGSARDTARSTSTSPPAWLTSAVACSLRSSTRSLGRSRATPVVGGNAAARPALPFARTHDP